MYDPMVAKLIVWDADREQATARMLRALSRVRDRRAEDAAPVPHGDPPDRAVGERGDLSRPDRGPQVAQDARVPGGASPPPGRRGRAGAKVEQSYTVEVSGKRFDVKVIGAAVRRWRRRRRQRCGAGVPAHASRRRGASAPAARRWRRRRRHARLADPGHRAEGRRGAGRGRRGGRAGRVIEAMKMENEITAHKAGTVVRAADRRRGVGRHRRHARRDHVQRGRRRVERCDGLTGARRCIPGRLATDRPGPVAVHRAHARRADAVRHAFTPVDGRRSRLLASVFAWRGGGRRARRSCGLRRVALYELPPPEASGSVRGGRRSRRGSLLGGGAAASGTGSRAVGSSARR